MKNFIHLHTHSYYSLLDGQASPEELVIAAKKAGMSALALTDHNGLYGAVEFYQRAIEHNIRPIIGAEISLAEDRLILLVKDATGYRNLCELISIGQLRGGHLNFDLSDNDLKKYHHGLIALSGGQKGLIFRHLKNRQNEQAWQRARFLQALFGEDFYLEMQQFNAQDTLPNLRLRDLGAELKIGLAATNDVHFISSSGWHLRRVLHAIGANTDIEKITTAGSSEQYFKNAAQMAELFKLLPEALNNTARIARQCRFDFELGKPVFPSLPLPEGESSFSWLYKKSFDGAVRRYHPLTKEVTRRLEYELQVIHDLGFAEYFLIVKNIVDYCHTEHIPCVGRGSAADSLVSYVLEITQVDPIRHNLYFERFLNPERSDPPDIDLDICWRNRDRVLEYVYDTFGRDRTAMICTFNTFQTRSAIRDVGKAYGLPEDELSKITRYLPHYSHQSVQEAVQSIPELHDLKHNLHIYDEIMRLAQRIADFPRHLSIHPGGVIIAPQKITAHLPLEVAGKGLVIAQYDMYSIEKLGLVKMDLLGVRSLSVITETLRRVRDDHAAGRISIAPALQKKTAFLLKKSADLSPLDLRTIPEADSAVTEFIRSGQTMGCFQLESPGMRGLLRKMQVDHVDDVITAVALIRPGAAGSGMKEIYIRRRAGLEETTYLHPTLQPALEETFGVIIYQEQVLRVAHFVARLSLSQADTLRRAMTKARSKSEFSTIYEAFIQGARNNGLDASQAETVWQFLAQFVGYGFNKAHSATYGTIAYQTSFLKYYFPLQYMCAVLNNQGGFYSRMAYIEEARRMGIKILPPDVHRSDWDFTCQDGALRCGLSPVFELTRKTIQAILDERQKAPFQDLFDFIRRTRAGEKETQHLIKSGAFNGLCPSAPQLLLMTQIFFKNKKNARLTGYFSGQANLPPFNRSQRIKNEMEMLDFAVSGHPLRLYENKIDWQKMVTSDALENQQGKVIRFCGWLVTSRRVETSKKEFMKFLTLEDFKGLCEVVLFPGVYKKYGHLVRSHGPFIIRGKVQSRLPGEANLIADELELVQFSAEEIEKLLQAPDAKLDPAPVGEKSF